MEIEQAEKLLDDLATQEELLCKRADDASGYTRSGNESIRTSNAKTHEQHAKEYRQILRYLAEYRLMQADYENRLKADIVAMLEEIELELDEARPSSCDICIGNEYQNLIQQKINALRGYEKEPTTKNDLGVDYISRQAVLDLINADWKYVNLEIEINNLPSVTPQERKRQ